MQVCQQGVCLGSCVFVGLTDWKNKLIDWGGGGGKIHFQNFKMQVPGCNVFIFLPCLLVGWAFPNETPLFPAQILGVSNQPILPTGGSYEKEDDSHGLDTGVGCSPSIITCLCCSFIKQAKQSQVVCKVFRVRIAPNVCQCSAQHTRLYALPAM